MKRSISSIPFFLNLCFRYLDMTRSSTDYTHLADKSRLWLSGLNPQPQLGFYGIVLVGDFVHKAEKKESAKAGFAIIPY